MYNRIKNKAKRELKKAKKKLGIKDNTVSASAQRKEAAIKEVAEKTGWTEAEARARMAAAQKKVGISFADYNRNNFFDVTEDKQAEVYKTIQEAKKLKEIETKLDYAQRIDGYAAQVMEPTGWTRAEAIEKMSDAYINCGMSFEHYAAFNFWQFTPEEQKEYFTKLQADNLRDKYNKDWNATRVFVNKKLFSEKFKDFLGRPTLSTDELTLDKFAETFKDERGVIYKPQTSTGGAGIHVYTFDKTSMEETVNELQTLEPGIIEGLIVQHHKMQEYSVNAVNTVRLVTVRTKNKKDGIEAGKVHFLYAGCRMGSGSSYVDNLHSGGMVCGVDIDTGIVCTDAIDFEYKAFANHPDTGNVIKGFEIPYFQEAKALIAEASKANNVYGYYGWDVAITEDGPVIIEGNTHPGAGILQGPYIHEKKGMKYIAEPFLDKNIKPVIPEAPYGPKISSISDNGIEFYWKKPEAVDGYMIYRSYEEDGEYTYIGEDTLEEQRTFFDKDFDHDARKVYYKVRSYVDIPYGTRVLSELTAPAVAEYREEMLLERDITYMYDNSQRTMQAYYGWGNVQDAMWSYDDGEVAVISADGIITAKATGTCTITCSSEALNQSAETIVVVNREAEPPLTEITSRFAYDEETGFWKNPDAAESGEAFIMMVGDMMCGKAQMRDQYTEEEGWNFNESYQYTREIMAESDFAVGNLETLLAAGWPYMYDETYIDNMNNCNATSRYLDAVKFGGFDAVAMSNNHNCDGGIRALVDTIDQVDRYKLANTGAFRTKDEKRFFIADVNGIKVGYVAYMSEETGFNDKDENWTQDEKDTYLNIFNQAKATADIAACREAGAEYVIAYMHWGFKNNVNVSNEQKIEAKEVADAGADYIVGSNPHLVQKYDVITAADGKKVPCHYSIGNYQAIMNQVTGNRDSIVVTIRLKKDNKGKVVLAENTYIPCYCYRRVGESNWTTVAVGRKHNKSAEKKNWKKIRSRIESRVGDKVKPL